MTLKRAEVLWYDAWSTEHAPKQDEVRPQRSLGWLVESNDRRVVIAQSKGDFDGPYDVLVIPRGMVRSIERLQVARPSKNRAKRKRVGKPKAASVQRSVPATDEVVSGSNMAEFNEILSSTGGAGTDYREER